MNHNDDRLIQHAEKYGINYLLILECLSEADILKITHEGVIVKQQQFLATEPESVFNNVTAYKDCL